MLTQMKSCKKYMYYYHYVIQFVLFMLYNFKLVVYKSENPHFICNNIEKASRKLHYAVSNKLGRIIKYLLGV